VTPGGELLDAANSGTNTVEAEIITAGVDLTTTLLTAPPAAVTGGMKIHRNGADRRGGHEPGHRHRDHRTGSCRRHQGDARPR